VMEELKLIPEEQIEVEFSVILMVGVTGAVTVIVMAVLVTVDVVTQADEVNTHRIKSPFTKSVPAMPV